MFKHLNFFLCSVAAFHCLTSREAQAVESQVRVLIIDEAADLEHSRLMGAVFINEIESAGRATIDDDKNGFIDDIKGWNAVSNNANFMPSFLKAWFNENKMKLAPLLSLYSKAEMGDAAAIKELQGHEGIQEVLSYTLGKSHGTHVTGIVNKNGKGSALVQNMNVFTGSENPSGNGNPSSNLTSIDSKTQIDKFIAQFFNTRDIESNSGGEFHSMFDNRADLDAALGELAETLKTERTIIGGYLNSHQFKVVNLSLGAARSMVEKSLDSQWDQELEQAMLPWNTARTPEQEENYQYILNGIYNAYVDSWHELFLLHQDVLFVIAAGNDSKDIDVLKDECTPAEAGAQIKNVLTVAATDKVGALADFSNYGEAHVSLGAWGQGVPSLAPSEMEVVMSGTSMAAPLVAGVASRVRAINTKLDALEVRMLLENTVRKVNSLSGKVRTGGVIDPSTAYAAAEASKHMSSISEAVAFAIRNRDLSNSPFFIRPFGVANLEERQFDVTTEGQLASTPAIIKKILFGQ